MDSLKTCICRPLVATGTINKIDVVVSVQGGNSMEQAGAVRRGIAKALSQLDKKYEPILLKAGLLTTDQGRVRRRLSIKAASRALQNSNRMGVKK